MSWLAIFALSFTILYVIDRAWKTAAIWHFFEQKPAPQPPQKWPALSLIQPVTVSPNNLRAVLTIRAQLHYPGNLEQIVVCDAQDTASQALCHELMEAFPSWKPKLVLAPARPAVYAGRTAAPGVALKTVKQLAGLELSTGQIVCFIDDDIILRHNTLTILVQYLLQPGIGAVFGLACYTNSRSAWSGLMSAFVNANALLNYIPLTYLSDPYTITGHLYALKRTDFDSIGGLNGMEQRLDDDHELAQRVLQAGLRNLQTPAIYNVDNELPSLNAFLAQMKRWFVFPRELMLPRFPVRQQILTFAASAPNLLPGLVFLLAFGGGLPAWLALAACLLVFYMVYFWGERRILKEIAPARDWFLLLLVALVLPFQIVFLLFSDNAILWRGQRYRVERGGHYEIIN
ncbi:MAG: glycosyltransferase [Chloroflexi bacterium]|nr:glycosyltransferase [Chloroflexota bacterium]